MSHPVTDTDAVAARYVDTIIIGSGFAGLGAAIKLSQQGNSNFLVLERGSDVGGTWRDNTYPGAACDVPSHLYSYSFALNPDWTRSFSRQPEIQRYIEKVAREHRVYDRHVFDCHVESARWNEATAQWDLETTQGAFTASKLVSAVGALSEPNLPDIPGIRDFRGDIFHSAQWDHETSLRGKRVAVIGTGASAIQIVPAIAPEVAHLDVYQRTAPWVLPRLDREQPSIETRLRRHPLEHCRETRLVEQHGVLTQPAAHLRQSVLGSGIELGGSPTEQRCQGCESDAVGAVRLFDRLQ